MRSASSFFSAAVPLSVRDELNPEGHPAQISRSPFRQACPFRSKMMWSGHGDTERLAVSMIVFVIWMSVCDGVGSPEGGCAESAYSP